MKKYTTPTITMSRFSNESIVTTSGIENNGYVEGIKDVENKSQVQLSNMKKVVSFTF